MGACPARVKSWILSLQASSPGRRQAGCVPHTPHTQPALIPQLGERRNIPLGPCQIIVELIMLITYYQKRRCVLCSELPQTSCLQAVA